MEPVDARIHALARQQHGVLSVAQVRRLGLRRDEIATRVRRGEFRSLWRGVVLIDADMYDEVPWVARVQGALLRHGPDAVVGLGTAARLLGIAGADTPAENVDVILPRGTERQQVPGITLHFWQLDRAEIDQRGAVRVTNAMRTLADLVPNLSRNPAVAAMDSALHQGLLSMADLTTARDLTGGRPYCRLAWEWWECADGRAESPLETWVRLDCHDHGLPPDELQWQVRNASGDLLGVGDLAWVKRRRRPLVAEADGADPHSTPRAVFGDRRRANNFVGANVDIIRLRWFEARRAGRCAAVVHAALNADPS